MPGYASVAGLIRCARRRSQARLPLLTEQELNGFLAQMDGVVNSRAKAAQTVERNHRAIHLLT